MDSSRSFPSSHGHPKAQRRCLGWGLLCAAVVLCACLSTIHPSSSNEKTQASLRSSFIDDSTFGLNVQNLIKEGNAMSMEVEEESSLYQYVAQNESSKQTEILHEHKTKKEAATGRNVDNMTISSVKANEKITTQTKSKPEIAWIMSFGGSGTSYTIVNTEEMTHLTTASNYGQDYNPCISFDDRGNGPYIRTPSIDLPSKFVLSKTHCGGYCMDCSPVDYIHSLQSFEKACRTGEKRLHDGTIISTTYEPDIPKRVVHLVRNPFDNLVGRMHLAMKHRAGKSLAALQRKKQEAEQRISNSGSSSNTEIVLMEEAAYETYTNDRNGMSEWCHYLDITYADAEKKSFSKDFLSKYSHIPCHSEWFRYIQWHNYAYQVHQEVLQLPVHYMFYENYTNDFNGSVSELFDFLEFPAESLQNKPYPWVPGKSYHSFFDYSHANDASIMVNELAIPAVWELIHHYFDDYFMEANERNDVANREAASRLSGNEVRPTGSGTGNVSMNKENNVATETVIKDENGNLSNNERETKPASIASMENP